MRDFENATRHKAPGSRYAPPGRPVGRGLVFSKRRGCSPRDQRSTRVGHLRFGGRVAGGSRERSGSGSTTETLPSHHSRPSAVPSARCRWTVVGPSNCGRKGVGGIGYDTDLAWGLKTTASADAPWKSPPG